MGGCCGKPHGRPTDNDAEAQGLVDDKPTAAEGDSGGKRQQILFCGGCCCCVGILCLIALTWLIRGAGEEVVRKHRGGDNITLCETSDGEWTDPPVLAESILGAEPVYHCHRGHGHLLTPANYTDYIFFDPCASPKLKEELKAFNAENEWELVHFPSRNGTHGQYQVTLAAWWLPVQSNDAPRIIVQHGNNVNFNDQTVTVAAYLLRSMGFACLVPNFRDHGLSAASDHESIGWGWDLHLDVLGAWDYAVRDPEGKLGGPMSHNKVGLMGFSMGGFATLNAFGLEPSVPAAWVDSGVFDPVQIFQTEMNNIGAGLLAPLGWSFATSAAGVDITLRTPAKVFPLLLNESDSTPRSLYLTQGQLDTVVPPSHSDSTERLIRDINEQANSTLIDLKGFYKPEYMCGESTHCTMHIWRPDVYRERLCDFWTGVFSMTPEDCGLANLPRFDEADNSSTPSDNSSRLLVA